MKMVISTRHSDNIDIWYHITSTHLNALLQNSKNKILMIDTRCESDYLMGHIKNAINISYTKYKNQMLNAENVS
jgi:predicted sulfurtransferase